MAKSPAFGFIKTTEAATLEALPPIQVSSENLKPGIWSGNNIYIIIGLIVLVIFSTLIVIGVDSRRDIQPLP